MIRASKFATSTTAMSDVAAGAHCTVVKKRDSRKPAGHVQIGWLPDRRDPTTPTKASTRPTRSVVGNRPTPPASTAIAAVGGVVAIVAHHEQMVGGNDNLGHVIEGADGGVLENRVAASRPAASRCSARRMQRAVLRFDLADAVRRDLRPVGR